MADDTTTGGKKKDKFMDRTPVQINNAGQVAVDALSEFIELIIEDLGPFGLDATGLTTVKDLLKKVGLDNTYVIHTADTGVRLALRGFLHDKPLLRETLIGVSDAYFDKLKSLPDKPTMEQVQRAKGEATKSGTAKLREYIAKKNAKPSFEKLYTQLTPAEQATLSAWVAWMNINEKQQYKEWLKLREKIGSIDILRSVLATQPEPNPNGTPVTKAQQTSARILLLEGIYATNPTMMDTLFAVANGEKTPHTEALERRVQSALTDRKAKAADAAKTLAATKKRYNW